MAGRGILLLALAAAGCAAPREARVAAAGSASCAAGLESRAGKAWWAENRWRYQTDEAASAAYRQLAQEASPGPTGTAPTRRN